MVRAVVVILVVATFVGAMMPGRGPDSSADNATPSEATPTSASSWGSGEAEVASSSSSYGSTIRLSRRPDGHFYADAKVNGTTINFLVDTGASGIALAYEDARRSRITVNRSAFTVVGEGASGPVKGQVIRIDDIRLGGEHARHVPGVVLEGGAKSLLGQSFLERFGSVEIRGDTMTLR